MSYFPKQQKVLFRFFLVTFFMMCISTIGTAQITTKDSPKEIVSSKYPTKIIYPKSFHVSKPVRDMPTCDNLAIFENKIVPKDGVNTSNEMSAKRKRKLAHLNSAGKSSSTIDPLIRGNESFIHSAENRAPIVNFEGIGLNVSPPDPSMAVGPNHVVTMENGLWAVYDKTGVMAAGFPRNLNDPLSGPTHMDNAGDPVVMYDRDADRWFLSQFQLSGNASLSDDVFLIGISTTPDPEGAWNVYEYELTAGNDYPHYGVWGDSYVTAGNFTGAQKVYTFNRTKMLAGDGTAEIAGFSPSSLGASGFAAPIPVHSEGAGVATGPIKIVYYQDDAFSTVATDHIGLWNINMNWSNIGASTISGKIQIPTDPFDAAIAGGFSNLQQPGTTQRIDAIVGAVMNMCHWYKFPSHESIVMNWVVEIQDGTQKSGIRWVELRSTNGGVSWVKHQEGTFTDPAGATVAQKESVFMGCISMDDQGNIGLGYTKTGSSTFPSLYYTGRLAGDPLGDMTIPETLVISGTSSVTGNDRYGDYGQAVRDPLDDQTFWVTSEFSGDDNRRVRVYSFKIAPDGAAIGFASPTANVSEPDDTLCFTDLNIPLNIAQGATDDAVVTFIINGSSTTTTGLDFDLQTPTVTFPSGSTASQNMVLRIYHDGLVEVDETLTIDFTVNPNTGDAEASPTASSFALTLSSLDTVSSAAGTVTIYEENFEDGSFNGTTTGNPSSDFWATGNTASATSAFWTTTGNSSMFGFTNDDACNCDKGNDLATTTAFSLVGPYTSATLTFDHAFSDVAPEIGDVLISTGGPFTTVLALSNTSSAGSAKTTPWVNGITVDMTPYIGSANVQVQFRYNDGAGWLYGMAVDNILVTAAFNTQVQTAVNPVTSYNSNINGIGAIYTSDIASGDVMCDITNNDAHDYGCTDVWVSRAGTGAQAFQGSVAPNLVMDKTFTVQPTNQAAPGATTLTFYFTEAEIAGWETAIGGTVGVERNNLVAGRENAGSLIETTPLTIGAFGTDVTLTGTFTGLTDTFYFGPIAAFDTGIALQPKVFLQGPYISPLDAGLMNDDLRTMLSTTSPYPDMATCLPAVFVPTGPDAIVDWVEVELRDAIDRSIVIEKRSALLQRDGDVVDVDGTSAVSLTSAAGNYYVLVNQRNHIGILSAAPIALAGTTAVDLSSNPTAVFGGATAVADMGGGVYALFSGDNDGNGQVQTSDGAAVILLLGGSGYSAADMDMNGQIQVQDINNIILPNTGKGTQY